jgi:hypothetical protein
MTGTGTNRLFPCDEFNNRLFAKTRH